MATVAWSGGTTHYRPYAMTKGPHGFAFTQSDVFNPSTDSMYKAMAFDWAHTTGEDQVRIPFINNKPMIIEVIFSQLTTTYYPGIIFERPPKSKNPIWGYSTDAGSTKSGGQAPSSTDDSGYVYLASTAYFTSADSSSYGVFRIRVTPAEFAWNDGGSTGTGTNAYENYVIVSPSLSPGAGAVGSLRSTQLVSAACSTNGFEYAYVRAIPQY